MEQFLLWMTFFCCRMLQTRTVEGLTESEAELGGKLHSEIAKLREQLMGKGLFRQFMEDKLAPDSHVEMACSSPAFVAAASGLVR